MTEHRTAVDAFAELPADRMTALTREHLDLCSYRLDAWIGGLAHRRLRTLRTRQAPRRPGRRLRLGREPAPHADRTGGDRRPGGAGRPARQSRSCRTRPGEGFIQTPSPTHAVTAAILRAAYRSQTAEGSFGNEMSVNLSSDRVRVALSLIDGVRAGNDLGALLGYRLERYLHEYYARPDTPHVVELDSTIFPLRRAYPTVAAVDPAAAAVDRADPVRRRRPGARAHDPRLDRGERPGRGGHPVPDALVHPTALPVGHEARCAAAADRHRQADRACSAGSTRSPTPSTRSAT